MPSLIPHWDYVSETHEINIFCTDDGTALVIRGLLSLYAPGSATGIRTVVAAVPIYHEAPGLAGFNPWPSSTSSSEPAETDSASTITGANARSADQANLRRSPRLQKKQRK